MNYKILDLLPFSGSNQLNSIQEKINLLKLIVFLCQSITKITKLIAYKRFSEFDPHVSENLCQIRAYYFFLIAEQESNGTYYQYEQFKENEILVSTLLVEFKGFVLNRHGKDQKKFNKKLTINEFIETFNLDLTVDKDFFFMLSSFILTKYKITADYAISTGIDYYSLCKDLDIDSKTIARKFIHSLQRSISSQSLPFIIKLIDDLGENKQYYSLLKQLELQDEIGRYLLPCFEITKIILKHAIYKNSCIAIKVHRIVNNEVIDIIVLNLLACNKKNSFSLVSKNHINHESHLITFNGIVQYSDNPVESQKSFIKRFLAINLYNIILANMAQHPQYAGKIQLYDKDNIYRPLIDNQISLDYDFLRLLENDFLYHKKLSHIIGCSQTNPSLFLITHIAYQQTSKEEMKDSLNQENFINFYYNRACNSNTHMMDFNDRTP